VGGELLDSTLVGYLKLIFGIMIVYSAGQRTQNVSMIADSEAISFSVFRYYSRFQTMLLETDFEMFHAKRR
jgi:hypothetical protein